MKRINELLHEYQVEYFYVSKGLEQMREEESQEDEIKLYDYLQGKLDAYLEIIDDLKRLQLS